MPEGRNADRDKAIERAILEAVRSLRFGSVEITVQNSHVTQLERREKTRFDQTDKIEYII